MTEQHIREPEDAGHWEGQTFVFDEPLKIMVDDGDEITLRRIDTSSMELEDGISVEDVISALLNPVKVATLDEDPE